MRQKVVNLITFLYSESSSFSSLDLQQGYGLRFVFLSSGMILLSQDFILTLPLSEQGLDTITK